MAAVRSQDAPPTALDSKLASALQHAGGEGTDAALDIYLRMGASRDEDLRVRAALGCAMVARANPARVASLLHALEHDSVLRVREAATTALSVLAKLH